MRKICKECKEEKDSYYFDDNRKTCRKCRNKRNRILYFSKEGNREKMREYQREYQREHFPFNFK